MLSNISGHKGEDPLVCCNFFRFDELYSLILPAWKTRSKQCSLSVVVFSKSGHPCSSAISVCIEGAHGDCFLKAVLFSFSFFLKAVILGTG